MEAERVQTSVPGMQPCYRAAARRVSRATEVIAQNRRGSAAACLRNLDDDELIDLLSPTLSDGDKRSQLNWTDYFAEPFYAAIAIAAISGLIHLYFTYHNSPYADFSLAFCLLLCLFSIVAVGGGHLDDNRRSTPRHVDLAEVPAHELRDADALRDATASPQGSEYATAAATDLSVAEEAAADVPSTTPASSKRDSGQSSQGISSGEEQQRRYEEWVEERELNNEAEREADRIQRHESDVLSDILASCMSMTNVPAAASAAPAIIQAPSPIRMTSATSLLVCPYPPPDLLTATANDRVELDLSAARTVITETSTPTASEHNNDSPNSSRPGPPSFSRWSFASASSEEDHAYKRHSLPPSFSSQPASPASGDSNSSPRPQRPASAPLFRRLPNRRAGVGSGRSRLLVPK